MARRRYGRRRARHSTKIPLLTTAAIAVPFIEGYIKAGGLNKFMLNHVVSAYTGYAPVSGGFTWGNLKSGWGPLLAVAGFRILNRSFLRIRTPRALPISLS